MSDNEEQCRAEFEAWAITEDGGNWFAGDPSIFNKRDDKAYIDRGMQSEWAAWNAAYNRRAAQPVVLSDNLRDKVRDAIAETLGDAYDCTRVWSAWSYGTMGPDDFSLIWENEERLMEITDAALNAILAAKEQA